MTLYRYLLKVYSKLPPGETFVKQSSDNKEYHNWRKGVYDSGKKLFVSTYAICSVSNNGLSSATCLINRCQQGLPLSVWCAFRFGVKFSKCCSFRVRDELQQLLNDEGGLADLNLTRKLAVSSPPVTDSSVPAWFLHYRAISLGTYRIRRSNNSRGEWCWGTWMLLEVRTSATCRWYRIMNEWKIWHVEWWYWISIAGLIFSNWRHFEQIDHGKQYAHELPLAIRLLGKSCLGLCGIM